MRHAELLIVIIASSLLYQTADEMIFLQHDRAHGMLGPEIVTILLFCEINTYIWHSACWLLLYRRGV